MFNFFPRRISRTNVYFQLDYKGNGYMFSAGRFWKSFGGTTVTYDELMVVLNTI